MSHEEVSGLLYPARISKKFGHKVAAHLDSEAQAITPSVFTVRQQHSSNVILPMFTFFGTRYQYWAEYLANVHFLLQNCDDQIHIYRNSEQFWDSTLSGKQCENSDGGNPLLLLSLVFVLWFKRGQILNIIINSKNLKYKNIIIKTCFVSYYYKILDYFAYSCFSWFIKILFYQKYNSNGGEEGNCN